MTPPVCSVTVTERKYQCTLPQGHGGQHKGWGWVWWHGNGEECPSDCDKCARLRLAYEAPR